MRLDGKNNSRLGPELIGCFPNPRTSWILVGETLRHLCVRGARRVLFKQMRIQNLVEVWILMSEIFIYREGESETYTSHNTLLPSLYKQHIHWTTSIAVTSIIIMPLNGRFNRQKILKNISLNERSWLFCSYLQNLEVNSPWPVWWQMFHIVQKPVSRSYHCIIPRI